MADSFFTSGGVAYTLAPALSLGRTARDVFQALMSWARPGRTVLTVSDAQIAEALERLGLPHSRRFVQKGLKLLQDAEVIARLSVEEATDWGVRFVRQIVIKIRFAASARHAAKSKKGKDLGPKKFGPPCAREGADPTPRDAHSLSSSREQGNENKAGAADVGREGPSSSPAGEPEPEAPGSPEEAEARKAAALADLKARVAESRAAPPPASPSPAPVPKRDKPPRAPDLTDDKLAEMAAAGDRAARAELNERHRREAALAAARADPQPWSGVDIASERDVGFEWTWHPDTGQVVVHHEPAAEAEPRPPDRELVVNRPPPAADRPKRGGFLGRWFGRE